MKPTIISIAGGSATGKSTLTCVLRNILGEDNVLILECDDLHLWEREHEKWESVTHLNPASNDLKRGVEELRDLKSGLPLQRKSYNHKNGKFYYKNIEPKKYIIHEGLHALCLKEFRDNSDIKIFLDVDEDLRIFWKLARDTKKRGHLPKKVLQDIENRKQDFQKYILPQKKYADIVIKYEKSRSAIDFSCLSVYLKMGNIEEKIEIGASKADIFLNSKNTNISKFNKKNMFDALAMCYSRRRK